MLKKINRLKVLEKIPGRSFNARFFILRVSENGLPNSRFGFIISKKIDKRAVVRNSLKRRLRSCLKESQKRIKTGFDILFSLKREAVGKTQLEICQEVKEELEKQKLFV